MPVYTYLCPCGCQFDSLQRMPGKPTAACPACGKRARRVIQPVAFRVQGGHAAEYDAYGPKRDKP